MQLIGRTVGLILFFAILVIAPCAFWAFNLDRVASNPQTYRTALTTQNFYGSVLPAFVDLVAADPNAPAPVRNVADALIRNMRPSEWALLAEKILPPQWLKNQLDPNIDRFFGWLEGERQTLDVQIDLSAFKTRIAGPEARGAAELLVPNLPRCTTEQEQVIQPMQPDLKDTLVAFCNPSASEKRGIVVNNLTTALSQIGASLPSAWRLADEIKRVEESGASRNFTFDLNRVRAIAYIDTRLMVLLFLIPVALFALIIMVTIRSGKSLFRWMGWALVLSGILTVLPIPFLTPPIFAAAAPAEGMRDLGSSGELVGSLVAGMLASIGGAVSIATLTQVAVAIGVGFLALLISLLLRDPDSEQMLRNLVAQEQFAAAQVAGQPVYTGSVNTDPVTPAGFGSSWGRPPTPKPADLSQQTVKLPPQDIPGTDNGGPGGTQYP